MCSSMEKCIEKLVLTMANLRLGVSFIFCALFVCQIFARETSDCYSSDSNPYLNFGTKTAYELIYERPREKQRELPECEPVQVWMLARHGTRYPSRSTIRNLKNLETMKLQIVRNHEDNRNGRLCYSDLDMLQGWVMNVTMADSNLLTPQGKADMYFLAKRLRTKFPSLFSSGYSQNLYVFRHTDTERTRQSAYSFAEGLFGTGSGLWIPSPLENDTVIRPYKNCSAWLNRVHENPYFRRQFELFKIGQEMSVLVHNVSQRLGFQYDLPPDTILMLYDMCRYDKAWNVRLRSAWCVAFTKEELKLLEYIDDMESFYDAGYGHEFNLRLGCRPIKDMIERFSQLEEENLEKGYQPTGIFYFTHSDMLAMTLASLGIASQGVPLRYDNYYDQKHREWRTSQLTPFAGNLAAVFYKCSTGEYNRVMFYLNEKLIEFPDCEYGLCSWTYMRDKFYDTVSRCDLHWCSAAGLVSRWPLIILLVFGLISKLA